MFLFKKFRKLFICKTYRIIYCTLYFYFQNVSKNFNGLIIQKIGVFVPENFLWSKNADFYFPNLSYIFGLATGFTGGVGGAGGAFLFIKSGEADFIESAILSLSSISFTTTGTLSPIFR